MSNAEKIIIGLTGPFGSGCTYIAKNILSEYGYEYISLSDILRSKVPENFSMSRTELQEFGNNIRKNNSNDFLAREAINLINSSSCGKFVVDSIRNTHEIEALKKEFSQFFLVATWASFDTRWTRVKERYNCDQGLFLEDDKRDKDEKVEHGQQITLCYQMADIIIQNEKTLIEGAQDYNNFKSVVKKYVDLIEKTVKFEPSEQETLMSMAYANSMRSSCTQRKVGALIIDNYGNVFSSGYNEVPASERPCTIVYNQCYRKYLRKKLEEKLKVEIGDEVLTNKVSAIIKSETKMLDYCRALHAEETAIVNMARLSVAADLSQSTLYTTTYPCNLCANKIAQVGIKKIVYYEPYPQNEAKDILKSHNIQQTPFEGVTFNGYFRFMEVLR